MNRLIRAEWYRVRHSSNLIKWLIALSLICVALPLLMDIEILQRNLTENLIADQTTLTIFTVAFLTIFSAVIVGIAYMNKTAYYEVMAGNKIYQIVFSKVFVDAVLVSVSVFLCLGIYWTVIGVCNGIGEIDRLPFRLCLLFLVLFQVCVTGILIATSVRHILSTVLVYFRFDVAETFIIAFLPIFEEKLSKNMLTRIMDWFTVTKLTKILSFEYEITDHLIFAVIAGLLIESAFWFGISYIGMKKKLYK